MTRSPRRPTRPSGAMSSPARHSPAAPPRGPAAAAIALWLAACSPDADPAQGGFLSGIGGTVGGGYALRIETRQDVVSGLRDEADRRETQRADRAVRIAGTRAEIEALEDELARLRRRIRTRLDGIARLDNAIAKQRRAEAAAYLARTEPLPAFGAPSRSENAQPSRAPREAAAGRIDSLSAAVAEARRIAEGLAALSAGG